MRPRGPQSRPDRPYADRHAFFYDLEMSGFREDLSFYRRHLPTAPCRVLELGCGSGRLGAVLAAAGHEVTGIDLSPAMLRLALARLQEGGYRVRCLCMDMTRLALRARFDAVLVPYHTLNLLAGPGQLAACLASIREHLVPDGRLLAQIHLSDPALTAPGAGKQFQFRTFGLPDGTRIIKEVLRGWDRDTRVLTLKETFRVRPPNGSMADWHYEYRLLGHDRVGWESALAEAGFRIEAAYGDYGLTPGGAPDSTLLLVDARPA
ncbi:MAG: class I SAM-dependent methyltransferase [Desulfobacteraceae bacterium]|nr:class I SAM-dependent methyltransferase [Desulfobacteraceae bacterium]